MSKSLPALFVDSLAKVSEIFKGSSSQKISPHVRVDMSLFVDSLPKKMEYLADIKVMRSKGMSVDMISKILNISPSYIYKLMKESNL